jgi:hypothetical protein
MPNMNGLVIETTWIFRIPPFFKGRNFPSLEKTCLPPDVRRGGGRQGGQGRC